MKNIRYWRLKAIVVALALGWSRGAFAVVEAPDLELLRQEDAFKQEAETKIQHDILDPILGKDKAKVFVDIDLEVMAQRRENIRAGSGMAERYKEKGAAQGFATQFILPGVPKPKNISPNAPESKPSAAQGQTAAQQKQENEEIYGLKTLIKKLLVTVIHDEGVLKGKAEQDLVRSRIVDALSAFKATPDQIVFRPTRFNAIPWLEQMKEPRVYIPLLYALLLLLLLSFLFGPLAKFMRRLVDAMREKKISEVTSKGESEIAGDMEGKGEGEGGDGGGPEESKLDIMFGQKPPEPSPESEEDEAMKKFEPFTYVNEENLKRLANLFLLRRYEPWLVAVVLSYLKPEFGRKVLALLPVELQSKVALEALMVRQITKEQLMAIDTEVKENIDFVVGGLEKLVRMIDEADVGTRQNILEHLKNEKPVVYERARRQILLFEDIAKFPDREMQKVIRELKTESMARALQGASPEALNKFLSNMSSGAAMLLKESMEFAKGLGQLQIDEERDKIMDVVKTMEKEGKVKVRPERGEDDYQEELATQREDRISAVARQNASSMPQAAPSGAPGLGAGPVSGPAPQADPNKAREWYQAAVQSHGEGKLDECVQRFRQAIDLDPSMWEAYQYLGTVLYQMGRYSEALIYYEKLFEYNPNPQLKEWLDSYRAQVRA